MSHVVVNLFRNNCIHVLQNIGACLTLEFVTRNANKYGGVVAFTGGLIGDMIYSENYKGDFSGTPVFIGTSNPDPHIPVERVYATTNILKNMNAVVT